MIFFYSNCIYPHVSARNYANNFLKLKCEPNYLKFTIKPSFWYYCPCSFKETVHGVCILLSKLTYKVENRKKIKLTVDVEYG